MCGGQIAESLGGLSYLEELSEMITLIPQVLYNLELTLKDKLVLSAITYVSGISGDCQLSNSEISALVPDLSVEDVATSCKNLKNLGLINSKANDQGTNTRTANWDRINSNTPEVVSKEMDRILQESDSPTRARILNLNLTLRFLQPLRLKCLTAFFFRLSVFRTSLQGFRNSEPDGSHTTSISGDKGYPAVKAKKPLPKKKTPDSRIDKTPEVSCISPSSSSRKEMEKENNTCDSPAKSLQVESKPKKKILIKKKASSATPEEKMDVLDAGLKKRSKRILGKKHPKLTNAHQAIIDIFNEQAEKYKYTPLKPWANDEAMAQDEVSNVWLLALKAINRWTSGKITGMPQDELDFENSLENVLKHIYDDRYISNGTYYRGKFNFTALMTGFPYVKSLDKEHKQPLILRFGNLPLKLKKENRIVAVSDEVLSSVSKKWNNFCKVPASLKLTDSQTANLKVFINNAIMYKREMSIPGALLKLVDYVFSYLKDSVSERFTPGEKYLASDTLWRQFGMWSRSTSPEEYPELHGHVLDSNSLTDINREHELSQKHEKALQERIRLSSEKSNGCTPQRVKPKKRNAT